MTKLQAMLARGRDVPVREWSERLWSPPEDAYFEPAFRRALVSELRERGGSEADSLVSDIERIGAVLTAHHVCPTNGPTFGAMDYIATVGQPGPILVLAWSGVPMSNGASSGAICFSVSPYEALLSSPSAELRRQLQADKSRALDGVKERRIVLIPPRLRDALVYECAMPARLAEVYASATPLLRQVLRPPAEAESYAAWALRTNESIARSVLARDNIWYVDLNRVAKRYLLEVLGEPNHVMSAWLHAEAPALRRWPWFYARQTTRDNRERVDTLSSKPEQLLERLATAELCPGLMPVFCALRVLSRIRLLGGHRQVEYLEDMARTLLACGLINREGGVPGALLTGRLTTPEGAPLYPFDVAVGVMSRDALPSATVRMARLWAHLLNQAATDH